VPTTSIGPPAEAIQPLRVAGDLHIAVRSKARILTGFLPQPFVEVAGVFGHVRVGLGREPTDDQARRVPGGSRRQLCALQQHDVSPAQFGQMVGHAATYDTAADDDNLCLDWEGLSV
jgi:hypothetical protein